MLNQWLGPPLVIREWRKRTIWHLAYLESSFLCVQFFTGGETGDSFLLLSIKPTYMVSLFQESFYWASGSGIFRPILNVKHFKDKIVSEIQDTHILCLTKLI